MVTNYNRRIIGIVNQLQDLFVDMYEEMKEKPFTEIDKAKMMEHIENTINPIEKELTYFRNQLNSMKG